MDKDTVIAMALDVVRCAHAAMENTEDDGEGLHWDQADFDALSAAMDKLDELPDDRPGYVMGPAAKVEWALQQLAAAPSEVIAKIDRALATVSALCEGQIRWTMRIPAEPDNDPDLIIAAALQSARNILVTAASLAVQGEPEAWKITFKDGSVSVKDKYYSIHHYVAAGCVATPLYAAAPAADGAVTNYGTKLSEEEFIAAYAARSETTAESLKKHFVALPCACGADICEGWAMVPNKPEHIQMHNMRYSPKVAPETWKELPSTAGAPPLDDDLRFILGRPCFTLISMANVLRQMGYEIASRAEDEQAVSIHWMLDLYMKHGKAWREEATQILDVAKEAAKGRLVSLNRNRP